MKIMKIIEDMGAEPKVVEATDIGIAEQTPSEKDEQTNGKKEDKQDTEDLASYRSSHR